MNDFFVTLFGETIGPLVATIVSVAIVLLLVIMIWLVIKRARSGMFIMGGKSRKPRLSVIDAAPIDQRRRLVLVRRDGVEHLILIGGPNDLVIESGFEAPQQAAEPASPASAQARIAAQEAETGRAIRRREPAAQPTAPAAPAPTAPAAAPARAPQQQAVPAVAPVAAAGGVAATSPRATEEPAPKGDDAWARLGAIAERDPARTAETRTAAPAMPREPSAWDETPVENKAPAPTAQSMEDIVQPQSLDDEMERLLNDLQLDEPRQK